jgi:hypothetical protein
MHARCRAAGTVGARLAGSAAAFHRMTMSDRDFRGAMAGRGDKGLLITTGSLLVATWLVYGELGQHAVSHSRDPGRHLSRPDAPVLA